MTEGDSLQQHRARRLQGYFAGKFLLYGFLLWLIGFVFFYSQIPQAGGLTPGDTASLSTVPEADAIIVLTGGEGRIQAGLALLRTDRARHMLISGVNPAVKKKDLSGSRPVNQKLFNCCVDLGRTAVNTRGNAEEGGEWARTHGYKRLIIVTNAYHVPRSKLLFRQTLPGADIIPVGVRVATQPTTYIREYHKYLFTLFEAAFTDTAPREKGNSFSKDTS